MGAIWLARHAPVSVHGVCYGRTDVTTACDAETAAAHVLEAAGDTAQQWQAVWSSPAERTRTVASVLSRRLALPAFVDSRIAEMDFGEWEGKPYAEIERTFPERFARWMSRYETEGPPGGESVEGLARRVEAWLREHAEDAILAVTHAGVIRVARAFGSSWKPDWSQSVAHLVPELVVWGGQVPRTR